MRIFLQVIRYVRNLPLRYSIFGGVLILVVVLFLVHTVTAGSAAPAAAVEVSHVKIASVASLSSQSGPLPLTGKVTSEGQATILAQTSGEIVLLNHALGDQIAVGGVIAEFENSSQQAAVVQAQGAYNAAVASLTKAQGTTATNSGITSAQAAEAAQNAAVTANASIDSTYAALDDAVHTKADPLFSNPRTLSPTLLPFTISNSQLVVTVQNERSMLEPLLASAQSIAAATTTSSIDDQATTMTTDALTVETFLNDLIAAVNLAIPNQTISASAIAADQTALAAARTEVVAAVSSLAAAKNTYDSDQTSAQTASNSASAGTNSDIALAQANVQEALGALDSAKAALEKTIVRSPISGVIVSLPITAGDYVSSFVTVAEVSNPRALEIHTYVTPSDAKTLSVNGSAFISGTVKGTITSIAPAIDPSTGQIQVKIGIVGTQDTLTDGDTVSLVLNRSISQNTNLSVASSTSFAIPIVAAKITPEGPVVFTVSSSTLISNPITFGAIVGDEVTVTQGLLSTMDIVTDARGLSAGQTIIVDSQ